MSALLLAVGGAGLYAYYGVKKPSDAQEAQKAADELLFRSNTAGAKGEDGGSEADAVVFTELTVRAKGETTRLEKRGELWSLVEPLETTADGFAVEAILGQLRTGKIKREVEAKPSEEERVRFGLKPPRFTVTANAHLPDRAGGGKDVSARTRSVTLLGGVENSFDGSVYLQREGDPKVYAAEGVIRQTLEKGTFDLRDKELFAFEDKAIRRLTVKAGSRGYSLERNGESGWKLPTEPADSATVTGMLSTLKGQRALAFPSSSTAVQGLNNALAKPRTELTLSLAEGEPLRFRFAQLKVDGAEKSFVLRQRGESALLAEIAPEAAKILDRDTKELRDRSVTGIKVPEVTRVAFKPSGSDPVVVVERTPPAADGGASEGWEDWTVIAPEKRPAAKFKISSALWTLEALKASLIVEEKTRDPGKYGFGPAARSVSLYGAEGKTLARIELGKAVPNQPELLYVRGARGQLLQVESAKLDALPMTLADVLPDSPAPPADAGNAAIPPPTPN